MLDSDLKDVITGTCDAFNHLWKAGLTYVIFMIISLVALFILGILMFEYIHQIKIRRNSILIASVVAFCSYLTALLLWLTIARVSDDDCDLNHGDSSLVCSETGPDLATGVLVVMGVVLFGFNIMMCCTEFKNTVIKEERLIRSL